MCFVLLTFAPSGHHGFALTKVVKIIASSKVGAINRWHSKLSQPDASATRVASGAIRVRADSLVRCPTPAPYPTTTASFAGRPNIISAPFDPIINVAALRLADSIVGMIDASTTRNPTTPRTRS